MFVRLGSLHRAMTHGGPRVRGICQKQAKKFQEAVRKFREAHVAMARPVSGKSGARGGCSSVQQGAGPNEGISGALQRRQALMDVKNEVLPLNEYMIFHVSRREIRSITDSLRVPSSLNEKAVWSSNAH